MKGLEIQIRTLTPLWTGGVDRQCDRLHETGLIGSLRWWYEALIRGLGGYACDPTEDGRRCEYNPKKDLPPQKQMCPACYLFGCTGWARRFRLQIIGENGGLKQDAIKKSVTFRFVPLRFISEDEWTLLSLTLRLIAEYGAIGGRTVLKPSDEISRKDKLHHRDYGLIQIPSPSKVRRSREEIGKYLAQENWRKVDDGDYAWASIKNFWCIKGRRLTREDANKSTFNRVVGRDEPKSNSQNDPEDSPSNWLAGSRQTGSRQKRESKKVFSFKADRDRTFGFVKPNLIDFDGMKGRLRLAWPGLQDSEFLTGEQILKRLLLGGDAQ